MINETKNDKNEPDLLNGLFTKARSNPPVLDDASFTRSVMAGVGQVSQLREQAVSAQLSKTVKRFNWIDATGLCVGLVACFSVVDMPQLVALANSILPDKVVLSPLTIIGASLTMSALAFSAWSALEGDLGN